MKGVHYISCFFVLFFLSHVLSAQISDEGKDSFVRAEKFIKAEKYQEALEGYLVVIQEDSDNANFNFRVGQCYMNILGQEREALPYLKKAVINVTEDYQAGDINNDLAAPLAWFLLGDAYHRDEDMEQASIAYHNYKGYVQDDEKQLKLVSERIMALGVSQGEVRDHARDVILTNMGERINSKSSDYNIVFSGDEKTMVFTRYEKRRDIIFASYFNEGSWSEPIDITDQIGSQGDMYATALSYDGKELYVVLLTAYDADIYMSEFKNGQWQYADNIGKGVNSKYIESNATISADGKTLYFSSDRAASIGGFDIFFSERKEDVWSKAVNLGEIINTKDNEESPHITNNGETLYFSSDRPGSIGRMDVYFSRKADDNWGVPENLGMPFNSVEDDISFKYYEKYRKGYIARDMPGGLGKLDLYLIQSGSDRQKELADYMASLAPPEPEPEPVDTTPVILAAEPASEELETDLPEVVATTPPSVTTVAAVAAVNTSTDQEAEEITPVAEEENSEDSKPDEQMESEREPVVETESLEQKPQPVEKPVPVPIVVPEKELKTDLEGEYTVQILALIYPKKLIDFRGLDKNTIREFAGDDGFTRYIFGQYSSEEEARIALRIAFEHGFKDAFVRSTSEISNFE